MITPTYVLYNFHDDTFLFYTHSFVWEKSTQDNKNKMLMVYTGSERIRRQIRDNYYHNIIDNIIAIPARALRSMKDNSRTLILDHSRAIKLRDFVE